MPRCAVSGGSCCTRTAERLEGAIRESSVYCALPLQIADLAPTAAQAGLNGNAGGVYVQGTLRMPREQLFENIQSSLRQRFGEAFHEDQF